MAKFFRTAAGAVGLRKTPEDEQGTGAIPPDATDVVEFDEDANAAVIADFDAGHARFSFAGGSYRRDGAPLAFVVTTPATLQRRGGAAGVVRVLQDRATTLAAFADVPDLQFDLKPGTHYVFFFEGSYTAAAAAVGLHLALGGPGLAGGFLGATFTVNTSATATLAASANAYDQGVLAGASGGAAALPFRASGTISTGPAGGVFSLRYKSETAGQAVTIKRGSYGVLWKVG